MPIPKTEIDLDILAFIIIEGQETDRPKAPVGENLAAFP